MTELSPSQLLRADIDSAKAEADRLLRSVNQETMKQEVRRAQFDLDEALRFLREDNVDERPDILSISNLAVRYAAARLARVDKWLMTYGPDVTMV